LNNEYSSSKLNVTVTDSSTAYYQHQIDLAWSSDQERPSIYQSDNKRTFSALWDSSISKDSIGKKGGHQR
jgi:hypothetical protein